MKILYIAGAGRSGSTLLEMILGNIPGHFSVGEILEFWGLVSHQDQVCGCGESFKACPFWSQIIRGFTENEHFDVHQILRLKAQLDRTRSLTILKFSSIATHEKMKQYQDWVKLLYDQVSKASGDRVIVDSSKTPAHLYILSQIPEIELSVLHLVRDPRAVAYSWKKRTKIDPQFASDEARMDERSYLNSMLRWSLENYFIEVFSKDVKNYVRMRYEDFAEQPYRRLVIALNKMGFPTANADLAFLKTSPINLKPTHSVGGNPVRFSQINAIKNNEDWKKQLSGFQKTYLRLIALPLMIRYGYSI